MKKLILIAVLAIMPAIVFAADADTDRPHWSLEIKGGHFMPNIDNWSAFYGRRYTAEYGGSLAYKIARQLEFGIEGMFLRDTGQGFAPIHQIAAGSVKYETAPLNVFVLARGVFSEKQWLVPYVGGGWTRIFYREEVQLQGVARGAVNGYHARAGVQLLLDGLDPSAANSFYLEYGVHHTYLFLEAERTKANVDAASGSVDIGGTSWLAGFLFEF